MTQHDDHQDVGPPPVPAFLVTIDDAHAALERLGDGTTVADLLRQIIVRGRDARVLIEPPMPPMRQYASLAELDAHLAAVPTLPALGPAEVLPALEDDPVAKRLGIVRCCDLHGVSCEPGDLCCRHCTERNHPDHPNVDCVLVTAERDAVMLEIVKAAGAEGVPPGSIMAEMIRRGRAWPHRSELYPALKRAMDAGKIVQPDPRARYYWHEFAPAGGVQ